MLEIPFLGNTLFFKNATLGGSPSFDASLSQVKERSKIQPFSVSPSYNFNTQTTIFAGGIIRRLNRISQHIPLDPLNFDTILRAGLLPLGKVKYKPNGSEFIPSFTQQSFKYEVEIGQKINICGATFRILKDESGFYMVPLLLPSGVYWGQAEIVSPLSDNNQRSPDRLDLRYHGLRRIIFSSESSYSSVEAKPNQFARNISIAQSDLFLG